LLITDPQRYSQLKNEISEKDKTLPGISMIVTTFNSELTIDECLRSIMELDYPKQLLEVIVIDGGSTDSTPKIAEAYPVKVIFSQLSAPAAYNYVLKNVENELIGLIDSDAKVEKGWLKKLVKHLNSPEIAGASGTVETWDKKKLVPRTVGYELNYRYKRLPSKVERIATMNLLLKRKTIQEIGGFDENLPTQYDTDLGARLTKAGYRIVFDSQVACYHFHRSTLGAFFKQQLKYGEHAWKLYRKHPRLFGGDKITDGWMNIQPLIYGIATILLIISIITSFHLVPSLIFLSIVVTTIAIYAYSAAKISYVYHDPSAMYLMIIYFTRAIAWTFGVTTSIIRTALTRRKG
jgi:cellulose synthase/poly-beta-1,6-N-acetylglucosamine synthase-like glycosyltransferase